MLHLRSQRDGETNSVLLHKPVDFFFMCLCIRSQKILNGILFSCRIIACMQKDPYSTLGISGEKLHVMMRNSSLHETLKNQYQ